jgi:hypothetical protein
MNGIQFLTDEKRKRTAAVIGLKKHKELWEDIENLLVSQSRRHKTQWQWNPNCRKRSAPTFGRQASRAETKPPAA